MKGFIHIIIVSFFILLIACKSTKIKSGASKTSYTPNSKSNSKSQTVLATAKSYLGTTYKYAGTDHQGIDCSGLAIRSYESVHIKLPRTAHEQAEIGKRIYIGELQVGDLVFFTDKKGNTKITHVGIISYFDTHKITFIHASTSHGVREDELLTGYWRDHYISATRIL